MVKSLLFASLLFLFLIFCNRAERDSPQKVVIATGPVKVDPFQVASANAVPSRTTGAEGAASKMAGAIEEAVTAKAQREQQEDLARAAQVAALRNQEAHERDLEVHFARKRKDDEKGKLEAIEHRVEMQKEKDKHKIRMEEKKKKELEEEENAKLDTLQEEVADLEIEDEELKGEEAREKERVKRAEQNKKIKVEEAKKKEKHDIENAIGKAQMKERFAAKTRASSKFARQAPLRRISIT